ncbi:MAG: copper chaperone PCu(A)C [Paracoccus denitrificans]|uniref:Copper chaperone PCu(A)C n=1 Tax=Paracoccus denitrificans TaxID=266 RepID=A0A533I6N3_PARDE|nr:MAG: copper chaperone PCu(A)C [Paracoccus denitrificans]
MMKHLALSAVIALILPATAMAHNYHFEITDAFLRSSNPKSGAAFMTILNDSEHDCTLSTVETPVADKAELHTSRENAEGMMEMLPIEGGITIPARGTHSLARGGDHVMLMGIAAPLAQGDEVPMTLDFGECGKVELLLPLDNDRTGVVAGDAAQAKLTGSEGHAGH